jgi:hypothetical protein
MTSVWRSLIALARSADFVVAKWKRGAHPRITTAKARPGEIFFNRAFPDDSIATATPARSSLSGFDVNHPERQCNIEGSTWMIPLLPWKKAP